MLAIVFPRVGRVQSGDEITGRKLAMEESTSRLFLTVALSLVCSVRRPPCFFFIYFMSAKCVASDGLVYCFSNLIIRSACRTNQHQVLLILLFTTITSNKTKHVIGCEFAKLGSPV